MGFTKGEPSAPEKHPSSRTHRPNKPSSPPKPCQDVGDVPAHLPQAYATQLAADLARGFRQPLEPTLARHLHGFHPEPMQVAEEEAEEAEEEEKPAASAASEVDWGVEEEV